jgi:hypothetical protein
VRAYAWAVAVAAFLALALPATHASAHEGNPNFRSELEGIDPSLEGLSVEVLDYDDSLQLTNRSGRPVLVEGYQGEPFLQILGDGTVQVNTRSPSYYLNDDRFGEVEVPASADPKAAPAWETVSKTSQYVWHDHRVHYMSRGTPPQVKDEGERTKVFDYAVPVVVDGRPGSITGTLFWVGEDDGLPLLPFVGLGAAALLTAAAVLVRRRRLSPGGAGSDGEGKEAW